MKNHVPCDVCEIQVYVKDYFTLTITKKNHFPRIIMILCTDCENQIIRHLKWMESEGGGAEEGGD